MGKWYRNSPTDLFYNDRTDSPFGLVWKGSDYFAAVVLCDASAEGTIATRVPSIEAGQRWVELQEVFAGLEAIA